MEVAGANPHITDESVDGGSGWLPRRSLLTYSPAMVALLTVILASTNAIDPDLWGHLLFGSATIAHGGVARVDSYSYSVAGLRWMNHEWLSQVLMAAAYGTLGLAGLTLIKLACAAAVTVFLAAAVGETGAAVPIQIVVVVLATLGLVPPMEFRPQIFTYALLSVVIALLARDNYRGRAPLWIAVPMMAVWANLHGGFMVGLGAVGLYGAVAGLADLAAGRGLARGRRLAALTAAGAAASLATPFGVGTWLSALHTISRPPMLEEIVEWQPLSAALVAIWHMNHADLPFIALYVGLLAGFALLVMLTPRGGDLPLVAIAAVMVWSAISAFRNIALAMLATPVPIARHAALLAQRWLRAPSTANPEVEPRASRLTNGVIGVLAIATAVQSGMLTGRVSFTHVHPGGAVDFMRSHDLHGNILAAFGWSDYVLYHCAPASHVFIDSRFEMIYPERIAQEFEDFEHDRPGAAAMLAQYPHDFVLIPPSYPAAQLMRRTPAWKLIYQDDVALLFARAGSPATRIPGVPVRAKARPSRFP